MAECPYSAYLCILDHLSVVYVFCMTLCLYYLLSFVQRTQNRSAVEQHGKINASCQET